MTSARPHPTRRKAVFMDRDGVINQEVHYLTQPEQVVMIPGSADAVRMLNDSGFLAIIISNQSAVARNFCTRENIDKIHLWMSTLLERRGARLDAIYYCPHHPDPGEGANPLYAVACRCRKPATGLIETAAQDFDIELSGSFFVGDTENDILCGKNSGLVTVGVETGYGCRGSCTPPDYLFKNLYDAVKAITQGLT